MRPLIGVVGRVEYPGDTDRFVVNDEYRRMIVECGGNAVMLLPPSGICYGTVKSSDIPPLSKEEEEMIVHELEMCDGILMPGGFKMLNFDFFILDYAVKHDIPILGICLGMQVMANYQREIWNEINESSGVSHLVEDGSLAHSVTIARDSLLYSILQEESFMVNSLHRYHVLANDHYRVVGYSEDGLIEAIEMPGKRFHVGVQWHPEKMKESGKKIFRAFLLASQKKEEDFFLYIHE